MKKSEIEIGKYYEINWNNVFHAIVKVTNMPDDSIILCDVIYTFLNGVDWRKEDINVFSEYFIKEYKDFSEENYPEYFI